jgi:hypothetical protein
MVLVLMNAAAIGIAFVGAAGIAAVVIWREERKDNHE